MSGPVTGVAWVGPLLDRGGYGNVARSFAFGLDDLGLPVRVFPIGPRHRDVLDEAGDRIHRMLERPLGPRPLLVIHATPDAIWRLRWRGFSRTACSTIFETDRIPDGWSRALRLVDEVWVPSAFNVATFCAGGVERSRLRRVPYGVDTEFWSDDLASAARIRRATADRRRFRFLYCFAFGWRKGFDLLLRAYREAFTADDDVELVLKVFGDDHARATILEIFNEDRRRPVQDLPRLVVIDEPIGTEGLRDLYASADFYVSTDRANGWGMPAMECMSMGVPSATIDWSGSTEFMTAGTAMLIKPSERMEPVHPSLVEANPHQYRGHSWPVVSVEAVRDVLRHAYDMEPDQRARLGASAAANIRMHFSQSGVCRQLLEQLATLEVADAEREPAIFVRLLDVRSLLHIYGPAPRAGRIFKEISTRIRR